MSFFKTLSISFFLFLTVFFTFTNAATFEVRNQCPYTVWAAAVPGGGRRLDGGQSWNFSVNASTNGRVWARTNCIFDGAGRGHCETGDCGEVLACQAYGAPPNTLAEYAVNQFNNLDFIDISLVDGFNVPMDFSPTSDGCSRGIRCAADINGQCLAELKAPGGCNNPCTVFKNDQYCCNSGNCGPTAYSRFFKTRCPDAYSYPKDDATSTFTCPGGTNYRVVFCPVAATFEVRNQCPYTVWAAAVPGGGRRLDGGQSWTFNVSTGTPRGRVWARTNCTFDGSGRGHCETGDCGGLLKCQASGASPNTIAEYFLNQNNNSDFLDISLVDGFNIPMNLGPATNVCSTIQCAADINGQCPEDLQTSGGCYSACHVFKTNEFCCGSCGPTEYTRFFKKRCPNAFSYPQDDATSIFTCPTGTNYKVVFCPRGSLI